MRQALSLRMLRQAHRLPRKGNSKKCQVFLSAMLIAKSSTSETTNYYQDKFFTKYLQTFRLIYFLTKWVYRKGLTKTFIKLATVDQHTYSFAYLSYIRSNKVWNSGYPKEKFIQDVEALLWFKISSHFNAYVDHKTQGMTHLLDCPKQNTSVNILVFHVFGLSIV